MFVFIIFIVITFVIYSLLQSIVGSFMAGILGAIGGAFVTFLLQRKSWETRVIQALPKEQRELFLDRTTKEASKLSVDFGSSSLFNATVGREGLQAQLFVGVLEGITDKLAKDEREQAIKFLKAANYNPLDKNLIKKLDEQFHKKYAEYYMGFRSTHGEDLVSSVPFPRLYKRSITRIYLPTLKELGVK